MVEAIPLSEFLLNRVLNVLITGFLILCVSERFLKPKVCHFSLKLSKKDILP